MKPTEEEIKEEAEKMSIVYVEDVDTFVAGAKWAIEQMDKDAIESKDCQNKPFPNFWFRLGLFMDNVQVNDQASEEEKEMIQNVCLKQLNAIIEAK